jgi:hypothetical protein
VTAVSAAGGRSPAAQPDGNGAANSSGSNGDAANGGTTNGPATANGPGAGIAASTTAAWARNGATGAAPGAGENGKAAEPSAGDSAPGAAPALGAPYAGGSQASASGTWSVPSSSPASGAAASGSGYAASSAADAQAAARHAQGAGQPGHAGQAGAADPIAEVPAEPASDVPSGYVPSPVSFVSDEDDEYGSKPGYGGYDRDRGGDAAQGGAASGWKDSGRAGKQDKVFDVTAGRRRPVVFEEEDDLDVPDFLK